MVPTGHQQPRESNNTGLSSAPMATTRQQQRRRLGRDLNARLKPDGASR
jgi:hypothetical protein